MNYLSIGACLVIVYLLEYDWILDILALIGIVAVLFGEFLLQGDYSENTVNVKELFVFSFEC